MSNNFNALVFAERVENGGCSDAQAKAWASALWDLVETRLATKNDLAALEQRLTTAIAPGGTKLLEQINEIKINNLQHKSELIMSPCHPGSVALFASLA